ncbi:hypothetical protein VIBNISO65_1020098 [Vibrio nigripulchritudo SO65]|nr:hypothetical protein VIBNIAM115_270043 [Vibrio nigripulchritudo AM115]CCN39840.1 hypothetical protein VIBNIFTn2_1140028 [Vibrio nigripulchritudo FTn2]CCN65656.1 hypothetical protein VIBNIPon4_410101 [Vibrio nigripulchritudo POn4]CCN74119.1 hypothetical protein VIBNISO65_1020098 [Vibrio nigripulchritudo SO65]
MNDSAIVTFSYNFMCHAVYKRLMNMKRRLGMSFIEQEKQ